MSQREILFKAKRIDNGEWAEGWYCKDTFGRWPVKPCIIPRENAENGYLEHVMVDGETVCQYTGLTDKNGKKIFEGDRVVLDKGEEYEKNGFVSYSNGVFIIQFEKTWDFLCTNLEYAETVGNIHDN